MSFPEEPFTPQQTSPRRRRTGLIIGAGAAAAVILTGGAVAYATLRTAGGPTTQAVAAPTSAEARPEPIAIPTSAAASTAAPSPTPAWTPCTIDGAGGTRKCEPHAADSCDFSEYSRLWSSGTVDGVLDSYIENRLFINPARLQDCPQFLPVWQKSLTGFDEGVKLVPSEVKPGTYQTTAHLGGGRVSDCYWERGKGGKIVANDFVSGAPKVTVTIKGGDDAFTSRGCGDWIKV